MVSEKINVLLGTVTNACISVWGDIWKVVIVCFSESILFF